MDPLQFIKDHNIDDPEWIADVLEDAKDYQDFLAKNGLDYDLEAFFKNVDGSGKIFAKIRTFKEKYKNLIAEIEQCQEMRKLIGIKNVTFKLIPREVVLIQEAVKNNQPAIHNPNIIDRYIHCGRVADMTLIIAFKLDLPEHTILTLYLAAKLHDIGHCALSHEGDDFLVYNGFPNHEKRGFEIIRNLASLNRYLPKLVIEKIINIIDNIDPLGEILSIADTLSYLQHDRVAFHLSPINFLVVDVINSIVDFQYKHLVLDSDIHLKELLRIRYQMYKNIYCSRVNKIRHAALVNMLDFLNTLKIIDLKEFAYNYDDQDVLFTIQEYVNKKNKYQKTFQFLFNIFMFYHTAPYDDWDILFIDTEKFKRYFNQSEINVLSIRNLLAFNLKLNGSTKYQIMPTTRAKLGKKYKVKINDEEVIVDYQEQNLELDIENLGINIYYPIELKKKFDFFGQKMEIMDRA